MFLQHDEKSYLQVLKGGMPGIRVTRKKTNQNGSWSVVAGNVKRHLPSQTKKNHIVMQGSSYGGRQVTRRHIRSHSWSSSHVIPTQVRKNHSSFQTNMAKGKPQSRWSSMDATPSEEGIKGVTTPPPEEEVSKPFDNIKGVTGLLNMRNTCYMNAALQALRHNTELSAFFLENKHEQWVARKPGSPKVELVKGYADLLRSLWSGSKPAYVRPEGFIQCMHPAAIQAGFDQFAVPLQHDSHEFLTFLLDQLHEGMAEEVNIEITRPPPVTPRDKAIYSALEVWKRNFGKSYSPLTEMIYGLMRVSLTCTKCGNCIDNWETFNCLKLPIPATYDMSGNKPTIQSMLADEFKEEHIDGYACEKCSPDRPTVNRKCSIWRLPRMLCLSIKRFGYDGRKIQTPMTLDMSGPISFAQYFSADSPEPSKIEAYDLFATVDHHGVAGGGHYTAQAKSPLTDKWHLFDDETAHSISEPQIGSSSYILFLKPSSKAAPA